MKLVQNKEKVQKYVSVKKYFKTLHWALTGGKTHKAYITGYFVC